MTSTPPPATPPVGPDAPADQTPPPAYEQAPAYQQPAAYAGPRVTSEQVRDLGRLRRIAAHRKVAGVAGGILGIALLVGQWDWFWVPGPLILVALVVWLFMSRRNDAAATTGSFTP